MSFTIKMVTEDVIKILIENRKKHIDTYRCAEVNYRRICSQTLRGRAELIESGMLNPKEFLYFEKLRAPVKYEHSYDEMISMLKHHEERHVELDKAMYSKLVLDNWGWSADYQSLTSSLIEDEKS